MRKILGKIFLSALLFSVLNLALSSAHAQALQKQTAAEPQPTLTPRQFLYVSNRYMGRDNEKANFISQYQIHSDGTLTPLSPRDVPTGKGLLGLFATPAGKFLYAVNTLDNTISQYRVAQNGGLVPLSPPTVAAGKGLKELRISANGRSLYAFPQNEKKLLQYRINSNGTLSPLSPAFVKTQTWVEDMVFGKSRRFAYAADASGRIYSYVLRADGSLRASAPVVETGTLDQSLSVHPSGQFLYDVTWNPFILRGFRIREDGSLSALPSAVIPLVASPIVLTFNPTGQFGYVANFDADVIYQFQIGKAGELTPLPPLKMPGTDPVGIVLSPSGQFVYGMTSDGAVLQYKISADGELVPLVPGAVGMGGNHTHMVIDATGHFAYVSGDRESYTVAQYKIKEDGTLSPLSPPSVMPGTNPFEMIVLTVP